MRLGELKANSIEVQ